MTATVTVFTRDACAACMATKKQLQLHGVDFEEVNVEHNPDVAQQLVDEGWRAMPVVKVDGGPAWAGLKMDYLQTLY